MRKPMRDWMAFSFGFLVLAAAAGAQQVAVQFQSPAPDQAIFGNTDFQVGVRAVEPIDRVELFVNGKLMGATKTPPYRFQLDMGEENVQREFKAVAYTVSGASGAASLVTTPVAIHDEMNLKLRALFVSVLSGGQRNLALTQEDFRVFDNGVEQEIVTFGRDELPLTAVLLLDTSESMGAEELAAVRRGAKAFLDGMKPEDEAMLALFSDRLLKYTPFTSKKNVLASTMEGAQSAGGTAVNDFLYMSLKALDSRQGQRVVVLFSDGSDVHSVLPSADVLWKAQASPALIYWIQLGGQHKSFTSAFRDFKANDREYENLTKAVRESGGRIVEVDRAANLENAFRTILRELREQYALGYYPTTATGDGKWHKVDVRVRGFTGKPRHRDGYSDY
jgi:Ca-activated chloride channel family protein